MRPARTLAKSAEIAYALAPDQSDTNEMRLGHAGEQVNGHEAVYHNAKYQSATPVLTIASPYYRDDPTGWLYALIDDPLARNVEIVLVDDGTGDLELDSKVKAALDAWPGPATSVRFLANQGRSAARNRAIVGARGDYILFMDADMMPGDPDFLRRYFHVIEKACSAIVFGGFKAGPANIDHDTLLNYSLASSDDCKSASERAKRGPLTVASNNLLVRRDVFAHVNFDSAFKGWGWEDTEWTLRSVFAGYGLTHIDNPAIHVGLDTTMAMLRKYKEAGPNLRCLLDRHPEAGAMKGVKVARAMAKVPMQSAFRSLYSWVARDPRRMLPLKARKIALKLWRASHAAEALRN